MFYGTSTPKCHTVPKQVSPLDDDDDITESTRKKCYGSTVWELHHLRTALCESIRYQATRGVEFQWASTIKTGRRSD